MVVDEAVGEGLVGEDVGALVGETAVDEALSEVVSPFGQLWLWAPSPRREGHTCIHIIHVCDE
jgi:hypothetical protein